MYDGLTQTASQHCCCSPLGGGYTHTGGTRNPTKPMHHSILRSTRSQLSPWPISPVFFLVTQLETVNMNSNATWDDSMWCSMGVSHPPHQQVRIILCWPNVLSEQARIELVGGFTPCSCTPCHLAGARLHLHPCGLAPVQDPSSLAGSLSLSGYQACMGYQACLHGVPSMPIGLSSLFSPACCTPHRGVVLLF